MNSDHCRIEKTNPNAAQRARFLLPSDTHISGEYQGLRVAATCMQENEVTLHAHGNLAICLEPRVYAATVVACTGEATSGP